MDNFTPSLDEQMIELYERINLYNSSNPDKTRKLILVKLKTDRKPRPKINVGNEIINERIKYYENQNETETDKLKRRYNKKRISFFKKKLISYDIQTSNIQDAQ